MFINLHFLLPAALALISALSACGEVQAPEASRLSPLAPSITGVSGSPEQWTHLSGDFTIRVHQEGRVPGSDSASDFSFERTTHVERRQQSDKSWRTTLTWKATPSLAVQGPAGSKRAHAVDITKAEFDDKGSMQLYDANGQQIALPDSTKLNNYLASLDLQADTMTSASVAPGAVRANRRLNPSRRKFDKSLRAVLSPASKARGFDIRELVVTPDARADFRVSLAKRAQVSAQLPNGNISFQEIRRDTTLETIVEGHTGLPIEIRASVQGAPLLRSTINYLKLSDSLYVRAHVVTQHHRPGVPGATIMESAWSNLQFGGNR